jgi:hypothetical protein
MHLGVSANPSIRIGAAHHREDGKQKHVRQLVEFALGATRVVDCRSPDGMRQVTVAAPKAEVKSAT